MFNMFHLLLNNTRLPLDGVLLRLRDKSGIVKTLKQSMELLRRSGTKIYIASPPAILIIVDLGVSDSRSISTSISKSTISGIF